MVYVIRLPDSIVYGMMKNNNGSRIIFISSRDEKDVMMWEYKPYPGGTTLGGGCLFSYEDVRNLISTKQRIGFALKTTKHPIWDKVYPEKLK